MAAQSQSVHSRRWSLRNLEVTAAQDTESGHRKHTENTTTTLYNYANMSMKTVYCFVVALFFKNLFLYLLQTCKNFIVQGRKSSSLNLAKIMHSDDEWYIG